MKKVERFYGIVWQDGKDVVNERGNSFLYFSEDEARKDLKPGQRITVWDFTKEAN